MTYVNCYKEECTHYCGRRSSIQKAQGNPIDLSVLSNPEPLKFESDREANLSRYAAYLLNLCNKHSEFVNLLRAIPDGAKLGCFCYPKKCHCEIIIQASNYFKTI